MRYSNVVFIPTYATALCAVSPAVTYIDCSLIFLNSLPSFIRRIRVVKFFASDKNNVSRSTHPKKFRKAALPSLVSNLNSLARPYLGRLANLIVYIVVNLERSGESNPRTDHQRLVLSIASLSSRSRWNRFSPVSRPCLQIRKKSSYSGFNT